MDTGVVFTTLDGYRDGRPQGAVRTTTHCRFSGMAWLASVLDAARKCGDYTIVVEYNRVDEQDGSSWRKQLPMTVHSFYPDLERVLACL